MRPECDPLVAAVSFIFLSATPEERGGRRPRQTQAGLSKCVIGRIDLLCQVHAQNELLWDSRSRSR